MDYLFCLSFRIDRIRFRIHAVFPLYLLSIAFLSSWIKCLSMLGALLIHESGHLAVCFLLHERIAQIDLTPFGGMIRYEEGFHPSKGIKGLLSAAAGPLANYFAILILSANPFAPSILCAQLAQETAKANLVMLCLNMLPVFPLDGGRIVFSLGYYLFPAGKLIRLFSAFGVAVGGGMILFSLYGLIRYQILNSSYILVGGYLAICAQRSCDAILTENMYAVIHERMGKRDVLSRVTVYCVSPDSHLTDLLGSIERSERSMFILDEDSAHCCLSDRQICSLLLSDPTITVSQAYDKLVSCQEKMQLQKNLSELSLKH